MNKKIAMILLAVMLMCAGQPTVSVEANPPDVDTIEEDDETEEGVEAEGEGEDEDEGEIIGLVEIADGTIIYGDGSVIYAH